MFLAMLDWTQCAAVERVPGKVSGAWVFRTTRVPVRALFENLEDGATVNQFLTWFPGVTREQVEAVLEHAERSLAVACYPRAADNQLAGNQPARSRGADRREHHPRRRVSGVTLNFLGGCAKPSNSSRKHAFAACYG